MEFPRDIWKTLSRTALPGALVKGTYIMNPNHAYRVTVLAMLVAAMAGGLTACNDQDKAGNAATTPAATQTASAPADAPASTGPVHHHREHENRETTHVATAAPVCGSCGTVSAVNQVTDEGQASGAGAVGGAVAGGVLGHQAGKGRGKDAMTVLGAIGGAVAGNYAEKQLRTSHHYEVVVRFNDGSTQTFKFKEQPAFRVGDHVNNEGGSLVTR